MLTRMLRRAVEGDPARAAVVQGSRRVSYGELEARAGRAAAGLRRLGVGPGACVAVMLPNGPEFVAAFFACARLRAIMLPLHPRLAGEEARRLAADAQARAVIADTARTAYFAGTDATVTEFAALLEPPPEPPPAEPFAGPALYLYTTGSTAERKRLCCTQRNLHFEALNFAETVGLTAADNVLCTIPLSHSYGLGNCLLDAVFVGSTLVLPESDDVPFAACCERVCELVREEAVRVYPGVPYQFQALAALPGPPDLAGLRLCLSSGDVLMRDTYERFLARFGLPIRSLYGSTEAGSISVNTDPDSAVTFGSLGPPLKNVAVRIREAGRDLPAGATGRIWVKSPVIPPTGYDGRPELSAKVFREGFYDTGDVGRLDARGHLVLAGRKQTFIEVGGYKVDLSEVKEALRDHPRVREAAAVGVDVPELGTLVKAVVVADGPCGEEEIVAHCAGRLAPFKVPRVVEFRDVLPRGELGKVLKAELGGVGDYPAGVSRDAFERSWQALAAERPRLAFLAACIWEQVALTLRRGVEEIDGSAPFRDMGLDSLLSAELHLRLSKLTGLRLPITALWNHPTIDQLAAALLARLSPEGERP
jgi:long-chain acyl-CoA synthetase